jgi:hypothetical protein
MKKFENGLLSYNLQFFADEGEASEGVNETEAAEQSEDEGEVTETENEGENEEVTEPQKQSPETNAAFANMRRQNQELTRRLQETDAMFARQFGKYTNPETGQPIRSAKDYSEAMAAQERMNAREQMQQNGIDPTMIDNLIANSPAVREAQAVTAELNNYRVQQMMEADFAEVMKFDPSMSSKEDILNDPSYGVAVDYVRSHPGTRFSDAYKIVNFDRLSSSKEAAVKQQTINQVKGKNHLSTGAAVNVSSDLEDIPADMLEDFKDRFPEKSPKELKALYNQVLKAKKG